LRNDLRDAYRVMEMTDDLTTAYLLGAEHMRDKLHKQSDEIERQAKRIAELEHQLKFECDTYLWNRKLMSRRIASLQGWMKKLFKYGSSPEAIRNQMTMTTEIPDILMREGEDLLLETSASEEGK
jgi:hypothetical protein